MLMLMLMLASQVGTELKRRMLVLMLMPLSQVGTGLKRERRMLVLMLMLASQVGTGLKGRCTVAEMIRKTKNASITICPYFFSPSKACQGHPTEVFPIIGVL